MCILNITFLIYNTFGSLYDDLAVSFEIAFATLLMNYAFLIKKFVLDKIDLHSIKFESNEKKKLTSKLFKYC